jgi:hypothetical protein
MLELLVQSQSFNTMKRAVKTLILDAPTSAWPTLRYAMLQFSYQPTLLLHLFFIAMDGNAFISSSLLPLSCSFLSFLFPSSFSPFPLPWGIIIEVHQHGIKAHLTQCPIVMHKFCVTLRHKYLMQDGLRWTFCVLCANHVV